MKTIKLETDLRPRAFEARRFWSPDAILGTLQEFVPIASASLRKCKKTYYRPDPDLPWAPSATAELLRDFQTTRKRPGAQARIGWLVGTWGLGSVIAMIAQEAKERGYPGTYEKLEDALDQEIAEEIVREEAEDA
jgi:hypothetical protein